MQSQEREKPFPFTNDYLHRINPFLHQLVQKYGKNCFMWMGPVPKINIAEAELIREVWTRMNDFTRPKLNPLISLLSPGLVDYEGEKWAKHRRLINPAFHMEKLKLMLPKFRTSVFEMVHKWEKIVSETGSSEIDVWPELVNLTADVISRAAFDSSYEEGRHIFELLTEQKQLIMHLMATSFIPGWKYLPTKSNKRMNKVNVEIQTLLKGIIEKRMKAIEVGEAPKQDLLGTLLDSNMKEAQSHGSNYNKQKHGMSFQELIDECKLFYLAGQETTSTLLTWMMILLSKHQDWQTQARDEVLATFGKNEPDFDGLNRLKIVTMIIYEVLRLYPPIVATSRKTYHHETKLGDIHLPNPTMVNISILEAHLNSELWGDDVKEFKPERFSEGIAKATKGNNSYFPFGWGPRICIGQNFALIEAKLALSMILRRFHFELSPSYTHAPTTVLSLEPQHGAHLILRRL